VLRQVFAGSNSLVARGGEDKRKAVREYARALALAREVRHLLLPPRVLANLMRSWKDRKEPSVASGNW